MALTSAALTTLANVKTELGITASTWDTTIERMIEVVSDQIANYCGRTLHYSAAEAEKVIGSGEAFLVVTRTPLLSITSITYDGATVSSSNYAIHGDGKSGLIYSDYGWVWTALGTGGASSEPYPGAEEKRYIVTYAGGYITPQQVADDGALTRSLPYDLEDAAIRMAAARYRKQGVDLSVASRKLGDAAESYFDGASAGLSGGLGKASGIPAEIETILNRYKRAVFA